MNLRERIGLINRCARSLANRGWTDIDFLLQHFDLPTTDNWRDSSPDTEFNYVRSMLSERRVNDEDLLALDDFLHSSAAHHLEDEPWEGNPAFRVFISHLAEKKDSATRLKSALEWWGFDAFVAHKDINPGKEWVGVIRAALFSCDALVGLLHQDFRDSNWCDQEVGIAFGRAIPTIPVRIEMDPYGFFGELQAVKWPVGDKPESGVAHAVIEVLVRDKRSSEKATEAIVGALVDARSYDQANTISRALVNMSADLSASQLGRLRKAQNDNSQVSDAWDVESAFQALEARVTKADLIVDEEEPF